MYVLTDTAGPDAEVATETERSGNTIIVATSRRRNGDRICLTDTNDCDFGISVSLAEMALVLEKGLYRDSYCVHHRRMWSS